MAQRYHRCLYLLLFLAMITTTLLYMVSFSATYSQFKAIFSDSCQIPDVDPWHVSLHPYVKKMPSLNCHDTLPRPDLTFTKGDVLFVNDSNIAFYGNLDFCEYVEILRPAGKDFSFDLGNKRFVFKDRIAVSKKEFIKVYCYATNQSLVYQNIHAFTPMKPALKHNKDTLFMRHRSKGYEENLNVLMVGLDSVSRLNFLRQFPKTRDILLNNLNAFELLGYNKVRDNTFINLVPMFLGQYVDETDWTEDNAHNITFDKYMYSWKKYAKAGYHTLFAEDAPSIAIWNYQKQGFQHPPADYYLRPFSLAMLSVKGLWHNYGHCFGEKLETDIVLDYITKFIRSRQKSPYFAFTFLTRPTYETVNQNTDQSHSAFLTNLINSNSLDNTVVIYFSDHGPRHSDILSTYIGKLEERLPAMYIAFPAWFLKRHSEIARNLQLNQQRLTTPFDINMLLDDILKFTSKPRKKVSPEQRGISLFDEVPLERTCETATIEDHWCTCMQRTNVSTDITEVKKAASAVLDVINSKTSEYRSICSKFSLKKVLDAMKSTPNSKLLHFKTSIFDVLDRQVFYGDKATGSITLYLISILVTPGDGIFEATVRYDASNNIYSVDTSIGRLDTYGNASWCVNNHSLKKFCHCTPKNSS